MRLEIRVRFLWISAGAGCVRPGQALLDRDVAERARPLMGAVGPAIAGGRRGFTQSTTRVCRAVLAERQVVVTIEAEATAHVASPHGPRGLIRAVSSRSSRLAALYRIVVTWRCRCSPCW